MALGAADIDAWIGDARVDGDAVAGVGVFPMPGHAIAYRCAVADSTECAGGRVTGIGGARIGRNTRVAPIHQALVALADGDVTCGPAPGPAIVVARVGITRTVGWGDAIPRGRGFDEPRITPTNGHRVHRVAIGAPGGDARIRCAGVTGARIRDAAGPVGGGDETVITEAYGETRCRDHRADGAARRLTWIFSARTGGGWATAALSVLHEPGGTHTAGCPIHDGTDLPFPHARRRSAGADGDGATAVHAIIHEAEGADTERGALVIGAEAETTVDVGARCAGRGLLAGPRIIFNETLGANTLRGVVDDCAHSVLRTLAVGTGRRLGGDTVARVVLELTGWTETHHFTADQGADSGRAVGADTWIGHGARLDARVVGRHQGARGTEATRDAVDDAAFAVAAVHHTAGVGDAGVRC